MAPAATTTARQAAVLQPSGAAVDVGDPRDPPAAAVEAHGLGPAHEREPWVGQQRRDDAVVAAELGRPAGRHPRPALGHREGTDAVPGCGCVPGELPPVAGQPVAVAGDVRRHPGDRVTGSDGEQALGLLVVGDEVVVADRPGVALVEPGAVREVLGSEAGDGGRPEVGQPAEGEAGHPLHVIPGRRVEAVGGQVRPPVAAGDGVARGAHHEAGRRPQPGVEHRARRRRGRPALPRRWRRTDRCR